MNKLNSKNLITLFLPIIFLFFSTYEKKLYIATAIFILSIVIFYSYYFQGNEIKSFRDNSINSKFIYLFLLCYLLITQNTYLNFESITWDVSSYLAAANEINLGFIPMETQWESKGPLTIYIYYFLAEVVNSNYLYFKILNDILLFGTICILISTFKLQDKKTNGYILASIFIISIFSIQWFVSEFTEFYCLPLIALSNYLFIKNKKEKTSLIGLCFGLSFLINQGSVLFIFPIIFVAFLTSDNYIFFKFIKKLSFTFLFPSLIFAIFYWNKNLLDVYMANYIQIPLGYSNESLSSFYELRVFLREISTVNLFFYFFIISLLIFYFLNEFLRNQNKLTEYFDIVNLNFICALAYYFIAGHNFYHHLVYLIYFSTFFITKINKLSQINLLWTLLTISVLTSSINTFPKAVDNLSNLDKTYENYTLKNLAEEIDENITSKEFTVLALDFVLVLHYLDKPNFSYIVHPTNHYQDYITNVLINLDKIKDDNIQYLLSLQPDVIICNTMSIDAGGRVMSTDPSNYGEDIEDNSNHFCNFINFENDYFQLNTESYRSDPNLNYYYDPYKEMNVFIKKDI
jgi:hypothetical protein